MDTEQDKQRIAQWNAWCEANPDVKIHLSGAKLWDADLSGADLRHADLSGADLWNADLSGAQLKGANLENANVQGVRYNRKCKCRGIRVATCYGSPRFKRFAQDQDFLEELRESKWGRRAYWPWLVFTNCGRSFTLWLLWSCLLAVLFAALYTFWLTPEAFHVKPPLAPGLRTMLYYSVVTFTTLGFGDVTPKTPAATYWVMAEVVLGYGALGLLISILAQKVARRS